jgi:hypothetical protein
MAPHFSVKFYADPWPGEGGQEYSSTEDAASALARALGYWGEPSLTADSSGCIAAFAQSCLEGVAVAEWQQSPYRAIRQNALRMLIATAPDMHVS